MSGKFRSDLGRISQAVSVDYRHRQLGDRRNGFFNQAHHRGCQAHHQPIT